MALTLAGDTLLAGSKVAVNALDDARARIAHLRSGVTRQRCLPGTATKPVKALSFALQLALAQILQDGLTRSKQPFHLQVITESDFAESLHEQALPGEGMAWLPRALVAADLKAGRMVLAGLSVEPIRCEIRLYRSR